MESWGPALQLQLLLSVHRLSRFPGGAPDGPGGGWAHPGLGQRGRLMEPGQGPRGLLLDIGLSGMGSLHQETSEVL